MEIQLVLVVIGTIGLLASFASSFGSGITFVTVFVVGLVVLSWVLSYIARQQQHLLLRVPAQAAADAVRANFSGVGWKQVNGRGMLNFQTRGFGINSYGAERPVISIDIGDQGDGTTAIDIWTSSWSSKWGMMALCDRVVSKKFWLGRKLAELSTGAIAPTHGGSQLLSSAQGGSRPSPSTSPDDKAVLADPRLPEDHPRQLAHLLMTSVGLSFLVYGAGDAASCFRALSSLVPVLQDTESYSGSGFVGQLRGRPGFFLLCFEGQFGSAIAICQTADADRDFSIEHIGMRVRNLREPWHWGIGTVGGNVPAGFGRIVDSSDAVELRRLPGLEQLPPGRSVSTSELEVPPSLAAGLLQHGWEPVGDGGFKIDIPVDTGRSLAVFFSPYNAESFALMTPLDKNEYVPAEVRARSFGRYELDVVGDMAVLCQRYPTSEPVPSADTLSADAQALATYTHQQFAGRPPQPSPPVQQLQYPAYPDTALTAPADQHTYPGAPPQQLDFPTSDQTGFPPYGSAPIAPAFPPTQPPYSYPPSPYPPPGANRQPPFGTTPPAPPRANWTTPASGYRSPGTLARPTPKHWVIAAAVLAVIVIVAVFALTRTSHKSTTSATGTGPHTSAVSVKDVSPCPSPPALQSQSATVGQGGLTIATHISPSCSGGGLLSNDSFRVTVVDAAGKDVASGIFDLSSSPIAVGSDGTSVQLIFPAGTYWRTPESIAGGLRMTAYKEGSDHPAVGNTTTVSAMNATSAGAPASGSADAAAQAALVDIAASDRGYIDANLLDRWEPQLSSKRPGLFADGITWSTRDIIREHMELRQRFPGARLVWSGDWPVYGDPTWWVTLAGVPFGSGEAANGWCASQGFDADHCLAKMLSHTLGSSGTTLNRK